MTELPFPTFFLLPTHIDPDELPFLKSQILTLTDDINEAEIVLGRISQKERAIFELRRRKIFTTEVPLDVEAIGTPQQMRSNQPSLAETYQVDDSRTITGSGGESQTPQRSFKSLSQCREVGEKGSHSIIKVVKLAWFTDSVSRGEILPIEKYLIYQGRKELQPPQQRPASKGSDILRRARDDVSNPTSGNHHNPAGNHGMTSGQHPRTLVPMKRPALLQETTSEHDMKLDLPPIPAFLHTTYSCQRPTHTHPPNESFINELEQIRTARALIGDSIGVRAYSTSIATLAAYPYVVREAREVARLPGCGPKIADLFQEWVTTGSLQEARKIGTDPYLLVLKRFYDIWGVAETTAREFYNKGWRNLDDIVEYGWGDLTRVQQIGVKYYDEFLTKIPREEVEKIGHTILNRANKLRQGFHMVIVGGYRRGKQHSGDVDIVLSHPSQEATYNFIEDVVTCLEKDNFITHTLTLSTKNSERGQAPLAWKGEGRNAASGFDTLDKALVVWQDPHWDQSATSKNSNLHRRVDIIISPWKTAGCAVLGWSGGTTFQRDVRRYCKKEKQLKFDSSGIRSRIDGHWVDFESGSDGKAAPDMLTAEKRIFEGLGLEWRPPEERCTG
ncbi:hypothetical protein BX600DRAFT_441416 [Xylariales sp. PMI_506]|nr:hypothetical protein BX600DRAFT_441416 [Xylariales sp. PMI_506]